MLDKKLSQQREFIMKHKKKEPKKVEKKKEVMHEKKEMKLPKKK